MIKICKFFKDTIIEYIKLYYKTNIYLIFVIPLQDFNSCNEQNNLHCEKDVKFSGLLGKWKDFNATIGWMDNVIPLEMPTYAFVCIY